MMPFVCQSQLVSPTVRSRVEPNRGEIDVDHACFLMVLFDELGVGVAGAGHLQHEIASNVLGEQRRSHLLLDGVS